AGWQAKTMDVLVLQEGCIVSMSTPYPPAPFRVRSGTFDKHDIKLFLISSYFTKFLHHKSFITIFLYF
ncbi:hypothetical protein COL70_26480, partial [Bacillus pseudomycoides]